MFFAFFIEVKGRPAVVCVQFQSSPVTPCLAMQDGTLLSPPQVPPACSDDRLPAEQLIGNAVKQVCGYGASLTVIFDWVVMCMSGKGANVLLMFHRPFAGGV